MTSGSVTIPGPLVSYLRAGLRHEIGSRLASLQAEIDTELDPETYSAALERLQSATELFDRIGLENRPDQPDVDIDLSRWARLLLKALEAQYRLAVLRGLQDTAAEDIHLPPQRCVMELSALVSLLRQKTCDPAPRRPVTRRRGDG
jgi:hypothetical protein